MLAPVLTHLSRKALRIQQSGEYPLYVFCLTAEEVLLVGDISRVSRDEVGELIGYQRPEVKRHIDEITDYLDGEAVIFPNPIIMALSPEVHFTGSRGPNVCDGYATAGTLDIPLVTLSGRRSGWIVDGQQRALALARSKHPDFPVPINAFIADSTELQREQFLRINNTRPLPRGLVTELLPAVSTPLSRRLSMRKTPSALCDLLHQAEESPFRGLIRRPSGATVDGIKLVVQDSSIVNMLEESLTSHTGCLFPYRDPITRETDFDSVWATLLLFWGAVRETFPEAWGRPPAESRLMHGAGIRAMGRLMDRILATTNVRDASAVAVVHDDLAALAPLCHWTDGIWEEIGLEWNAVQNVPRHINALSSFLIRAHMRLQGGLA